MAITYDRPNVFGTLLVVSGEYSGEVADFDIDLSGHLSSITSMTITPTAAAAPATGASVAITTGRVAKVQFVSAGAAGNFMAIGTR